jgi:dephospho-CoA kinase
VIAAQDAWIDDVFARDPDAIAMVESALIFEAGDSGSVPGWRDRFDRIVLVTAPDEVKIQRFLERLSAGTQLEPEKRMQLERDARARLEKQIPDSKKIPRSDYVIDNGGPLEKTQQQVDEVFASLKQS